MEEINGCAGSFDCFSHYCRHAVDAGGTGSFEAAMREKLDCAILEFGDTRARHVDIEGSYARGRMAHV